MADVNHKTKMLAMLLKPESFCQWQIIGQHMIHRRPERLRPGLIVFLLFVV